MAKNADSFRVIEGAADERLPEMDASGAIASGESEHALLAAGKIDVEEFIEMSVDRALAHLQGQVAVERLDVMREVLRDQLKTDPDLAALVSRIESGD